ncbi:hypothetical protein CEXT_33041 [Caerostris extrusa]|uniref:Uncharacterized protein n=1 Tax=Caerostris extrusa TaxID=172846 RepID=A0AAV4VVR2_CAEEX|nr:hypothetical protein CEXT_33041 [Caerostris extrusa]
MELRLVYRNKPARDRFSRIPQASKRGAVEAFQFCEQDTLGSFRGGGWAAAKLLGFQGLKRGAVEDFLRTGHPRIFREG